MQTIKGIGIGLTGFFLLISLLLLGPALTLNNTLLSPRFVATELKNLDVISEAGGLLVEQIPPSEKPYAVAIDNTLTELKPWLNQQLDIIVDGIYAYVMGKTNDIKITLPTEILIQSLILNFTEAIQESPSAEYLKMSEEQKSRYLTQSQQQLRDAIPFGSILEINQEFLGSDVMNALSQAKGIAGSIRTGYFVLLVLALVFLLCIGLILREIKSIARSLGIIFLVGGLSGSVFFLTAKYLIPNLLSFNSLPSPLQTWIPQIAGNMLSPWGIFNLVTLILGAILLTISFFVRGRSVSTLPD